MSKTDWSKEFETFSALHQTGMSNNDLALHYNVRRQGIEVALKRFGLTSNFRRPERKTKEEIHAKRTLVRQEMFDTGPSLSRDVEELRDCLSKFSHTCERNFLSACTGHRRCDPCVSWLRSHNKEWAAPSPQPLK